MKYTKGEWEARQTLCGDFEVESEVVGELVNVACAYLVPIVSADGEHSLGSVIANANLIASAPDLYEALEEAFDSLANDYPNSPLAIKVGHAIMKAKGK